jgi:hypothetical protein
LFAFLADESQDRHPVHVSTMSSNRPWASDPLTRNNLCKEVQMGEIAKEHGSFTAPRARPNKDGNVTSNSRRLPAHHVHKEASW